jgi:ribosome-dependent ATPase
MLAFTAFVYVISSTAFGLVMSTFMGSQIAAIFGTAIGTMIPAIQFAGMINPISSLTGIGHFIGQIHPTTYFLIISRGIFSKGLGFTELWASFIPILLSVAVLMTLCISLLKKQEK